MKNKLILIADDDPEVVKLVSLKLEAHDYRVITAASGKEALARVERERPDLVILDYSMPEGDGVYVMTSLRTALETFTIPVILLTAYASKEIRQKTFGLSASAFLTKPFNPSQLLNKVREALGED